MFEVLDHPADIGFRAFARTLPELFENAALALLSIRAELDSIAPASQYPVSAQGSDTESLLVNWLSEILYWVDGRQIALREVKVTELSETSVSGVGRGEIRVPARHHLKVIVKAVTYHQLKVARSAGGWVAEVYLDV